MNLSKHTLPPPRPAKPFVFGPAGSRETDLEGLFLLLLPVLAIPAFAWMHYGIPLPKCPLMLGLGLPCLTCGGTRCASALAELNFSAAFQANPLIFLTAVMLAAAWIYCLIVKIFRLPHLRLYWMDKRLANTIRLIVVLALLLNWAYLFYTI
ncbi:MAG: DUF2752 domain-containing protein [Chthoniobacterales bacterium]